MAAPDNVGVIRGMLDAVARGDRDTFLGFLTRDVEWDDREGWPGVARIYHGQDGVRDWWDAFVRVGGEVLDVEVDNIGEVRESVVLLCVLGTFRASSGADSEFKARAWYVFWLRGGKVGRAQLFWNRRDALEAAGVLEQEGSAP